MIRVLAGEFLKLKRAPLLWISILGLISAPGLNALLYWNMKQSGRSVTWDGFFMQSAVFLTLLIGTLLFTLVTTYLFGREFEEHTATNLFVLPVNRGWIITAKFSVLLVWVLSLGVVCWLVSIVFGIMIGLPGLNWSECLTFLGYYLNTVLLSYLTLPLIALLTMYCKRYIPPIAFAVVLSMCNIIVINSKYGPWFPWTVPAAYLFSLKEQVTLEVGGIWLLIVLFITGFIGALVYTRYVDISDK